MRRYGATAAELDVARRGVEPPGCDVIGFALHLPLAGSDTDRLAEIEAWLPHLDPHQPLWVSHLGHSRSPRCGPATPTGSSGCGSAPRCGTATSRSCSCTPTCCAVHPSRAGDPAGYQLTEVLADGTLVAIGAGSAHGVAAARPAVSARSTSLGTRLTLLEPPHMHTSMVVVPTGAPCPPVGDRVDVQRPLITTWSTRSSG